MSRKDSVENKILSKIYPSREEFEQYYIEENHSQTESAKHFNITRPIVQSLVEYWNMSKSKEKVAALNKKNTSSDKHSIAYKVSAGIYPTKEKFIQYYIVECHSRGETAKYFNISESGVESLKKYYNTYKSNIDIKKTKEKTCFSRYGVCSNLQTSDSKEKIKQTCLKKYGVEHITQYEGVKDKIRDTVRKKYGVEWPSQLATCKDTDKYIKDSKPNIKFAEKLQANDIKAEREFPLKKYVFDFKIGDILIEIDPWYTHQSTFDGVYKRKEKEYHSLKTEVAQENNYHCIHIFDWDDQDKIINTFLKQKEKVYGRECEIKEVPLIEEKDFLNKYHLQGYVKSNICLGLYFKDELVQLMSFGVPRYNKNYEYELLRLCSSRVVVGGANKIFSYFLKNYSVKNIVSYCDLAKFNGKTYENLGFTLIRKKINKYWYSPKLKKHITDNLLRQHGFDRLFGDLFGCYGKGTNNDELMLEHGFVEIYGSGQATYVFENN